MPTWCECRGESQTRTQTATCAIFRFWWVKRPYAARLRVVERSRERQCSLATAHHRDPWQANSPIPRSGPPSKPRPTCTAVISSLLRVPTSLQPSQVSILLYPGPLPGRLSESPPLADYGEKSSLSMPKLLLQRPKDHHPMPAVYGWRPSVGSWCWLVIRQDR